LTNATDHSTVMDLVNSMYLPASGVPRPCYSLWNLI